MAASSGGPSLLGVTFATLLLAPAVLASTPRASPSGPSGTYDFFPPTSVGYFDQVIDHFTYDSAATFPQKFLVYDKFWQNNRTANGTNGAVFFFFGGEGGVEDFYNNSGALFEYAPEFGALVVFLEHRYYGTSVPVTQRGHGRSGGGGGGGGGRSDVVDQLRYLTIEQALADTTEFLASKAEVLGCAPDTPVVLWGGSYGGMLAAWHRYKFPHISAGAVASSAPITLTGLPQATEMQEVFYNATLFAYGTYGGSPACAPLLDQGLAAIAAETDFGILSQTFATCPPVDSAADVDRLVFYAKGAFATLTMLDYPCELLLLCFLGCFFFFRCCCCCVFLVL